MATFEIVSNHAPYYQIRVEFDGMSFDQLIFSNQVGEALQTQLQAYADAYAAAYVPA